MIKVKRMIPGKVRVASTSGHVTWIDNKKWVEIPEELKMAAIKESCVTEEMAKAAAKGEPNADLNAANAALSAFRKSAAERAAEEGAQNPEDIVDEILGEAETAKEEEAKKKGPGRPPKKKGPAGK